MLSTISADGIDCSDCAVTWIELTLDELEARKAIGYGAEEVTASEPTAIAALAFFVHGRFEAARRIAACLAEIQQLSGMVSVRPGEDSPGWPTSLAVITWSIVNGERFQQNTNAAVQWLLANRGRSTSQSAEFGHNTQLIGWSYAEQTHSWIEPTAFGVLALKAAGKGKDPATREGVSVLLDRHLPGGGLNYGNTYVLGQLLRAHIQPTGIGLLALAGERDRDGRIAKSITWLAKNVGRNPTPQSLAWGLLGLRAHRVEVDNRDDLLEKAASQVQARDRSPYKLALLALAAKGWPA
jgi:hypothetical protein